LINAGLKVRLQVSEHNSQSGPFLAANIACIATGFLRAASHAMQCCGEGTKITRGSEYFNQQSAGLDSNAFNLSQAG
jgi:hypothetical protein